MLSNVNINDAPAGLHACNMGSRTETPCPYSGVVPIYWNAGEPQVFLCRYHAATEPLQEESDELRFALDLIKAYIKGARKNRSHALVDALERVREDFSYRQGLAHQVLEDLQAAELQDMRG